MTQTGAPLPPINQPFLNDDGSTNMNWYQFLLTMQNRTGGAQGISSAAVQATASTAQSTATTASGNATSATVTARLGLATADAANTTATSALTLSQQLAVESLIKTELILPLSLSYTGGGTGLVQIFLPIVSALTMPANLTGLKFWCASRPTTNVGFAVNYYRGGGSSQINTFTVSLGTNATIGIGSTSPALNLQSGDVLWVETLSTDVTFGNWSVTFPFALT